MRSARLTGQAPTALEDRRDSPRERAQRSWRSAKSGRWANCVLGECRVWRSRDNDRIGMTKHDAPLAVLAPVERSHAKGEVLKLGSATQHRLAPLDLVTPGDVSGHELGAHIERRHVTAAETTCRCLAVLDTSGHLVAAGPHGFTSVTSSRREKRSIAGPGSPVTKTCHASSHWWTNSSMSIALPRFSWTVPLAHPRARSAAMPLRASGGGLRTFSCPRPEACGLGPTAKSGQRSGRNDGSGRAMTGAKCPRTC
jgi:hypothetical protein